jgi:hypothetical protein
MGQHVPMNNSLALCQAELSELIALRIARRVRSAYERHNHVGYAIYCGAIDCGIR